MYKNFEIKEVTPENEERYLQQIADLEQIVLDNMIKDGREGQLFITGKEDISGYIHSKNNIVMIATKNDEVIAATYITRGQMPFTYNDITKYFKYGEEYKEYVNSLYNKEEYSKMIVEVYAKKVGAYMKAVDIILEKNGFDVNQMSENDKIDKINEMIQREIIQNEFHEKSNIREELNQYMSKIMESLGYSKQYEQFYWLSISDITKSIYGMSISCEEFGNNVKQYEKFRTREYEKVLKLQKYRIYEKPDFEQSKYFLANTNNAIELDTYITDPNSRENGLARILVNEGIRKCIIEHFNNSNNSEIFLCSTLHRENTSSKYVSEFFGLEDSLFVKRRQGRDREVHICKVDGNNSKQYLQQLDKKIAVLYGYNPRNLKITLKEQIEIIKEQLNYEIAEIVRLRKIKRTTGKYKGEITFKKSKIQKLQKMLEDKENEEYER